MGRDSSARVIEDSKIVGFVLHFVSYNHLLATVPGRANVPSTRPLYRPRLLLLRLMVGIFFFASGWSHLKDPAGRGQSIGMSKGFTTSLGLAEVAGSLGVVLGVFEQLSAMGLILVMPGDNSEQDFCLAHRLLGEKRFWLALRLNLPLSSAS